MRKKHLLLVALFVSTLGLGTLAGFWLPRDDTFFAIRKNFQIFGALYEELSTGYVDDLDPERLMRRGITAMLDDLDPYTTFIDEADNADIDIITRGRYGGVGLNVSVRNGQFTVTSPIEGTSGYKQGVRTGDVITHVAGKPTGPLSVSDVRHLLRGEPGTTVAITVQREGEPEPLPFILTREQVRLKNVSFSGFIDDDTATGLGYVKLERFAREAGTEVRQALQQLQETGHLRGLVLDLRDNPGGLLDAAVEIVQLFVPQGSVIVSTSGRLPQTERIYRSKMPPLAPDLPVAVLVNEYSASASEIVAGAIQDLDRGVIVGVPSFGKGLVQVIKPLPYNTSLKMTTSKYFTPSGRSIQAVDYGAHDGTSQAIPDSLRRIYQTASGRDVRDGRGIEPDVLADLDDDSELEQALERRAAFFFYANHYAALHNDVGPGFTVGKETLRDFRRWLDEQDFAYRTSAERELAALSDHLLASGYAEAEDEVALLRTAIEQEKQADFDRHAARLQERLRAEILARYAGDTAQIKASFAHDLQLRRAASVLSDRAAYQARLGQR